MTTEKLEEDKDKKSMPDSINTMEFQLLIAETLNNLTRIRILLLLWTNKELSINDLCEKLDKTRPTILKHLKKLKSVGLIKVRRTEKRTKLYHVIPNLLELTRLDLDYLKNLPSDEVKEILEKDLDSDKKTIHLIKRILEDSIPYYQDLKQKLKKMLDLSSEEIENFYRRKHINYYVEVLDEEEYQLYYKFYEQFLKELEDFRNKKKEEGDVINTEKPFAAFHILLPIKEIQEARFNRKWKNE